MLRSRRVFAEEPAMLAHSLPPAPAVLMHTLDRWLEQQCETRSPSDFEQLLDRLRPHLPTLQMAIDSHDPTALTRLIERLAIELNITELLLHLPAGQRGVSDPGDLALHGRPTAHADPVLESGLLGPSTPPLRTLLDRVQQMLQPRSAVGSTWLAVATPPQVELLARFAVEIEAQPELNTADATAVSLSLPSSGSLDFEAELQRDDSAALELLSADQGLLRILADGRSTRLSFLLLARRPGHHRLTVVFRQHGMERRRISRSVYVRPAEPSPEGVEPKAVAQAMPEPCQVTPGPAPRGIVLRLRQAPLQGGGPRFVGELFGPALRHAPLQFEVPLGQEIAEASAEFCRRIGDLTDLPSALESELRVRALGEWLAKLLLRDEPRLLLDSPDIPDGTPLHIESHDLWVPWELLLLNDRRSGHELFLGEKFAVSRWIDAGSATEAVGAGRVALVAPPDTSLAVEREQKTLAQLRAGGLSLLHSLAEVQALLHGATPYGVLHFACHADNTADRIAPDYLVLKDDVLLRPFDVPAARNDVVRAIAGGLVFINACQTAIVSPSMARDRGWARAFIGGGAAALVACAWTVKNSTAARFAEEFYRQARLGVTLAEAARQARCRIRPLGEHEPLGYALYAAPEARLLRTADAAEFRLPPPSEAE